MNLFTIFSILIIHWVGDFVLQTDKQAKGKSKNLSDLLSHTFTYTFCWFIFLALFSIINNHVTNLPPSYYGLDWRILLFLPITFVAHTITDYFTSRLNSKLWAEGKVHSFFVSVGFDQILHYLQLFLTFHYLTL
jgi:hypothetical protein